MKFAILATMVAWAMPSIALAADKCADPQDQATMNECADASFKANDKKLNALYRQIETRLKDDPETIKLLVQAQRDWVKFRDAECAFRTSGGGSAAPMVAALCANGLTQSRLKDFERYLMCEEGDMSCPVPAGN